MRRPWMAATGSMAWRAAGGDPWLVAEDEANLLHPQVSPDGRWVAVTRLHHERRIVRMRR